MVLVTGGNVVDVVVVVAVVANSFGFRFCESLICSICEDTF